jgi:hypothetical protein
MFDFIADLFSGRNSNLNVGLSPEQKKEVDDYLKELVLIGHKEDFLSERPGGAFNGQCHHRRTREIGEKLNKMGGIDLMWKVFYRVKRKVGKQISDHLEYAWSGIGQWMA